MSVPGYGHLDLLFKCLVLPMLDPHRVIVLLLDGLLFDLKGERERERDCNWLFDHFHTHIHVYCTCAATSLPIHTTHISRRHHLDLLLSFLDAPLAPVHVSS